MLLKVVCSRKLQPRKLATHRFAMPDILKAYETSRERRRTGRSK